MRKRRYSATPGVWPEAKRRARVMRTRPTAQEARLWQALRSRRFQGLKFRRQHPVGPYIVDFISPEAALVVEVDGPVHGRTGEEDRERQAALDSMGLRTFRCTNEEVERDLDSVLSKLAQFVAQSP